MTHFPRSEKVDCNPISKSKKHPSSSNCIFVHSHSLSCQQVPQKSLRAFQPPTSIDTHHIPTKMASAMASNAAPLPIRLMNFFAKYPPKLYSAKFTGQSYPPPQKLRDGQMPPSSETEQPIPMAQDTSSSGPNSAHAEPEISLPEVPSTVETSSTTITPSGETFPPNPFLPQKNYTTGRWRGAPVGLRRQAELVKLARSHGVEPLLPPGPKGTIYKQAKVLQQGLRVRGTGEGQQVKGHKWERTQSATLEKRRKAMEEMPELIREWKQRGHGRGWKKYPK